MVEIFDKLPPCLTGLIRAIKDPLFHAQEIQQLILVTGNVGQIHIFADVERKGAQHQVAKVHIVTGDVAKGLHHGIGVHTTHPGVEQPTAGRPRHMKINRGDHGDQILDLFWVKRRVTEAKGTPLTDAQQIDLLDVVGGTDGINTVVDVAVDIVVEGQPAFGRAGVTPVDQIDIDTKVEQVAHQRAILLEINHVGAIDQGVGDEQGRRDELFDHRLIPIEH